MFEEQLWFCDLCTSRSGDLIRRSLQFIGRLNNVSAASHAAILMFTHLIDTRT
jgi:hypothetical protein